MGQTSSPKSVLAQALELPAPPSLCSASWGPSRATHLSRCPVRSHCNLLSVPLNATVQVHIRFRVCLLSFSNAHPAPRMCVMIFAE